ncbi:MAG: site-specific DNA-methyltransferase [Phycisphaerae bacterium]|jgi:adenine-specific DNA-methyltransferase|nr:site-specific DNA-methyltransferase [Phycisphaerae bacterium]MCZ2400055.1 site-specific DNA-methyltransferase [Phycisphaerae bacterium]
MTEPEKLDLRSHDIASDRMADLLRLFPEIRTEGGKLDFERLKLALGEAVDVGKERYGMNWPGKADCFKTIQTPSVATLRPCPEESVNWDTTENLIIEGDNLEVLKLLQKSYLGKVKMIYIDPPYNTGNDFIYPDDYAESLRTYLEYTGQVDAEGRKFGTNTDADGRFHSKWMNMMYPRLYLARNLLRDDGLILISCDDTEVHNLRALMNEVFGEDGFVAHIVWQKRYVSNMTARFLSDMHDHVLVFSRNVDTVGINKLERSEEQLKAYKNPDNDPRGPWRAQDLSASKYYKAGQFTITTPSGLKCDPPPGRYWRCNEKQYDDWVADNRIWFGVDGTARPMLKAFLSEASEGVTPNTWWSHEFAGHNKEATLEVKALFDGASPFDTAKPVKLIKRMLETFTEPDSIVLDFFAGSGTTGHAVLEMNQQDGGSRRFILTQLPELCDTDSEAFKAGYRTIADICKERIRRVVKNLTAEDAGKLDMGGDTPDRGFRVFKLAESNFTEWDARVEHEADALEKQLELHVEHIRDGRSADDILYELLLKSGFPLTTPVEKKTLAGKTVYSVAGGVLLICLERELTLELIRAIADAKPERVVCLDAGFAGNDQLKANAVQTFRTKGITSFKTV